MRVAGQAMEKNLIAMARGVEKLKRRWLMLKRDHELPLLLVVQARACTIFYIRGIGYLNDQVQGFDLGGHQIARYPTSLKDE